MVCLLVFGPLLRNLVVLLVDERKFSGPVLEARARFQKRNLEGKVRSVGELMISSLRAEVGSFVCVACHLVFPS